jgi:predicted ATPase
MTRRRIAVSGSHATGKSTLVRGLTQRLPGAIGVDEPYYLLTDEGHTFSDPPSVDDFELLFERSVATLAAVQSEVVIFDRSPADYLAYLVALRPDVSLADYVRAAAEALARLDLVVYVPIETPDRIQMAEAPRLRRRVDAVLRDMLIGQTWGFDAPVLEVQGTPSERASQIVARLDVVERQ